MLTIALSLHAAVMNINGFMYLMKYDGLIMAVGENPVLSGSSVMKYDFILRPIIIAFNQPGGLTNCTRI